MESTGVEITFDIPTRLSPEKCQGFVHTTKNDISANYEDVDGENEVVEVSIVNEYQAIEGNKVRILIGAHFVPDKLNGSDRVNAVRKAINNIVDAVIANIEIQLQVRRDSIASKTVEIPPEIIANY